MDPLTAEKLSIRETVENWVIWRDSGDWDRFRTVWHPEGWMNATWFQGPAEKFIEVSRDVFNKGVNILRSLRRSRHRSNQDDDQPESAGTQRHRGCDLHWPDVRLHAEA